MPKLALANQPMAPHSDANTARTQQVNRYYLQAGSTLLRSWPTSIRRNEMQYVSVRLGHFLNFYTVFK